jgi:Tfp pilus assembly ATPase PilU
VNKEEQLLKHKIVALVRRNGQSMILQEIADHLTTQEKMQLPKVLTELVSDGHLLQGFTLLSNGQATRTYA